MLHILDCSQHHFIEVFCHLLYKLVMIIFLSVRRYKSFSRFCLMIVSRWFWQAEDLVSTTFRRGSRFIMAFFGGLECMFGFLTINRFRWCLPLFLDLYSDKWLIGSLLNRILEWFLSCFFLIFFDLKFKIISFHW